MRKANLRSQGIDPDEIEGTDGTPNDAFLAARLGQMRLQQQIRERRN